MTEPEAAPLIPCVAPEAWQDLAHLFDPAEESCAFMVGRRDAAGPVILEFWPTDNVWEVRRGKRAKDQGYAIATAAWNRAKAEARRAGLAVLGHCHTHPGSTAAPSFWDYRTIKPGEWGGVWHLRSGRFTLFTRHAMVRSYALALPALFSAYAAFGAASAVDLAKLPPPAPVAAPPVPAGVVAAARHLLATLRDPAALAAALAEAGLDGLDRTEVTAARLAALETALSDYGHYL